MIPDVRRWRRWTWLLLAWTVVMLAIVAFAWQIGFLVLAILSASAAAPAFTPKVSASVSG